MCPILGDVSGGDTWMSGGPGPAGISPSSGTASLVGAGTSMAAAGEGGGGIPWGAIGALGSGILGYAGQQNTNNQNMAIANANNAASAAMAEKQMDFQERMSNSAYQRATADMTRAGINPMLAYMKGGADSPGGAQGQRFTPQIGNALGAGVSSALDSSRLANELSATSAQVSLNRAMAKTQETQQELNQSNAAVADENADLAGKNNEVMEAKLPAIKKQAEYDAKFGTWDAIQRRALPIFNSARSIIPFTGGSSSPETPKGSD